MARRNRARNLRQSQAGDARDLDSTTARPAGPSAGLAFLAIVLFGLGAYANSWGVPFVFDDHSNIVNNVAVHWTELSWLNMENAVRHSRSSSRPLANLSFGLNHYFCGQRVLGYHVVNVAIHLVTGLLVFLLASTTFRLLWADSPQQSSRVAWAALAAALVFVCHPIQIQAVTYIVQRMTSMCVMFYLAALLSYVYGRVATSRGRIAWWSCAVLCWLAALASKQIAATLPLAILLYEWCFFRDLSLSWLKANVVRGLLLVALLIFVAWLFLGNQPLERLVGGYADRDFTLGQRLLTQMRVVVFYLSLIVWPAPWRLNLAHDFSLSRSLFEPATLLAATALLALLLFAVFGARRWRLASFCILWFFLHLAIESTIIPLEMVFEHRLYLPMVGVALLFGGTLFSIAWRRLLVPTTIATILCLLLTGASFARHRHWQDAETFWRDAVTKSPDNARARLSLGFSLQRAGKLDEALAEYERALDIRPLYPEAHYNLGNALQSLERYEEAIEHYKLAAREKPTYAKALNNWGVALRHLGRFEEAIEPYERAIKLQPRGVETRMNYAFVLDKVDRPHEAIAQFRTILSIAPRHADALNSWGMVLGQRGQLQDAAAKFQQALAAEPCMPEARKNLHVIERLISEQRARGAQSPNETPADY
ncbi:MAG: tetratricopeptide repeat protein [Planctomycetota bacterium]|nr:MAG: tetratricopeptide repeat protein [Planctomycetota bacterium]